MSNFTLGKKVIAPFKKRATSPTPFKCAQCGLGFQSRDEVLVHVQTHSTTEPEFHCKRCGKTYRTTEQFERHTLLHSNDKPFHCTICNKRYMYNNTYNTHMLTHQTKRPFPCTVCEKSFCQSYNLKIHMKTHTGNRDHMCPECGKMYYSAPALTRHRMSHLNDRKYHCIICDKRFLQSGNYLRHMRIHTGERFTCDVCGRKFAALGNLKKHLGRGHARTRKVVAPASRVVDDNDRKRTDQQPCKAMYSQTKRHNDTGDPTGLIFKCEACDQVFNSRKEVRKHVKIHLFNCTMCEKYFETNNQLQRHLETHGQKTQIKCPICAAAFVLPSSRDKHMETVHKNDPPIECETCGFICYKHNYKTHMMKHGGKKVYDCQICGREFIHASSFIRHKSSHEEKRKFECDVCGKKFLQKSHFKKHLKIHSGNKEFKCKICGREFHEKYYFRKHMTVVHSSQTPFLCEICGEAFESEGERNDHMNIHDDQAVSSHQYSSNDCSGDGEGSFHNLEPNDQFIGNDGGHGDDLFGNAYSDNDLNESAEINVNMTENVYDMKFYDDSVEDFNQSSQSMGENSSSQNELKSYYSSFAINSPVVSSINDDSLLEASEQGAPEQPTPDVACHICGLELTESCLEEHIRTHKAFFCTICCKKFYEQFEYEAHLEVHTEKQEHRCDICKAVMTSLSAHDAHMAMHHEEEQPIPCEYCEKPLLKHNYDAHMMVHVGNHPYHCQLCGKTFSDATSLASHKGKIHNDQGKHECTLCSRKFARLCHYNKHMRTHSSDRPKINCRACNRQFFEEYNYKNHMARMHPDEPIYACTRNQCNASFDQDRDLQTHLSECTATHDASASAERYDCAHCDEIFYTRDDIIAHLDEHTKNNYRCKFCGKLLSTRKLYEKHIALHADDKPFECEVCHRRFSLKKTLKNHMIVHRKKKPFQCPKCPRSYCHNYDFKRHVQTHDNPTPYECGICQKRFTYSVSVTRHMKVHDGKKQFQCCICLKCFAQSCQLTRHMKIHTNEREFHCTICRPPRRFIVNYNYKRHMITVHSSETPFLCEICGECFSDENLRNEHLKKHEHDE